MMFCLCLHPPKLFYPPLQLGRGKYNAVRTPTFIVFFLPFRISDRGGGIPEGRVQNLHQYSFSTTQEEELQSYMQRDGNAFDGIVESLNADEAGGTLSGYGFGLPSSLVYAKFLGGSLQLMPMYGLGTDVFLKLAHITKPDCFRI